MLVRQFKILLTVSAVGFGAFASAAFLVPLWFPGWLGQDAAQQRRAEAIRSEEQSLRKRSEDQHNGLQSVTARRAVQEELLITCSALHGLQTRLEKQREALRREWAEEIHRPLEEVPAAGALTTNELDVKSEPRQESAGSPNPALLKLSRRQEAVDQMGIRVLDLSTALQDFQSSFSSAASTLAAGQLKDLPSQLQQRHATFEKRLGALEAQVASGGSAPLAELADLRASWNRLVVPLQGPKGMIQSLIREREQEAIRRQQMEGLFARLDAFLLNERQRQLGPVQRSAWLLAALVALGFALSCARLGRRILSGLRSWAGERSQYQATLQDWELRHEEAVRALEQRTEQCRRWLDRVAERGQRVGAIAEVFHTIGAALRQKVESLCAGLERQSQARSSLAEAAARLELADAQIRQGASGLSQIASQSRILSFNASVEASRSGVAGAAFLVVADAMRQLAERSAATAAQIEASCQDSSQELAELQIALASLEGESLTLDRAVADLSECVQQQAQGSRELSEMASLLKPASARGRQGSRRREKLAPQAKLANQAGVLQMVPSAQAQVRKSMDADCDPQRFVA